LLPAQTSNNELRPALIGVHCAGSGASAEASIISLLASQWSVRTKRSELEGNVK
jgi:hypothetical protein